ncbi:hypothetical protein CHS0354_001690 [Potamilus streckersoni]|uniref:Uncharacterized protein n=1 Tax=Potamilus streckersoni TaxID=2493646 RepID=A0AAE0VLT6_9BIVA|nr:hypothetical protein CHS0354_001690 [Potamilus streckersoni]
MPGFSNGLTEHGNRYRWRLFTFVSFSILHAGSFQGGGGGGGGGGGAGDLQLVNRNGKEISEPVVEPNVNKINPSPYTITLETQLRSKLFTDYDLLQRPNQTVNVMVSLSLLTINSLIWEDSRLSWNGNTTYDNIRFIFSNENYMWRPAVIVENSVSDMSVISDEHTFMRIISDGHVVWTPGGIYEIHCDCDVTYYPLDKQTCSLVMSTWAYTSREISLVLGSEAVLTTYFSENGEWELVSVSGAAESSTRESQSFSHLKFILTLRRRPLFHILNTILPVVIMATLIVMVFKLPPESGERIGMSLTALLAYAVYLSLISDNIPRTSKSASVLSIYLTIVLCLSVLTVILTIVVLDLYFNIEEDDVPVWLKRLTHHVLIKFSCWKRNTCCRLKIQPIEKEHVISSNKDITELTAINAVDIARGRKKKLDTTNTEQSKIPEYTWKEIALIIDKFLLALFSILVLLTTVITLTILGTHY